MRGPWRVTQGVAGTTHLDAVHRVIGRPGVILVAEGAPHRVKRLLAQEKKRTSRVVGKTPIYDFIVGNEEGQVPLRKLQRHLTKLPAQHLDQARWTTLETRLAALGSRAAALPKGPLPAGREDAQHPAHRPPALTRSARVRTTTVRAARSCQPRPSASRTSARHHHANSAVRSSARGPHRRSVRPSSDATRSPSTAMPGVTPNAATGTAVRTNQTPSTSHANHGLTDRRRELANSAAMQVRREPVDRQRRPAGARTPPPSPTPSAGRPSRSPGIVARRRCRPARRRVPGIQDSSQRGHGSQSRSRAPSALRPRAPLTSAKRTSDRRATSRP